MPDVRLLLDSGRRVAGSAAQRREYRAYMKYVARRKEWRVASAQFLKAVRGGAHTGNRPPNFLIDLQPATEPLAGHNLMLGIANAKPTASYGGSQPTIRLATTTLVGLTPPWVNKFDDPEDMFAAHRFGWLLPLLAADPSRDVLLQLSRLAFRWIEDHSIATTTEGWDSYSISERVVNWIILLAVLQSVDLRADAVTHAIHRSIQSHAKVLSERLEFRGVATNNHLINNGRALYFAGTFLGDSSFQALGREILQYGLQQMFTTSGFLREGSAHYHILLCRTYLESYIYAQQANDYSFAEKIRAPVAAQVRCAEFFQDHSAFPLIGDVSPDASPEFHGGVASLGASIMGTSVNAPVAPGPGWHTLFGVRSQPQEATVATRRIQAFPDAGYYGVDWAPFKLTVYGNPLGYVPAWSHGHSDIGGFILEWEAKPILVDCGRSTYKADPFGRYGRSARSHNTIMIDHFEPCVVHAYNGFVPAMRADYYDRPTTVEIEERENSVTIRLRHFGFQRLQDDLIVTRAFKFSSSVVQITDEISGSGTHLVETFFHLHPQVEIFGKGEKTTTLAAGALRLSFTEETNRPSQCERIRGRQGDRMGGWFSPRYGALDPTTTLRYSQQAQLPLTNTFTILSA